MKYVCLFIMFLGLFVSKANASDLNLIGGGNLTTKSQLQYKNIYGAHLIGNLAGPVTLGVLGTSNGTAAGSLGVEIGEHDGGFGFIAGKNVITNANLGGMYVYHEIGDSPINVGSIVTSDINNVSYGLSVGIHW